MSISLDELQLAARNHGMPLEALRYDVTPVGLHYLLIHFDVPDVPSDWRLRIGGLVERELSLSLDDLHPASRAADRDHGMRRERTCTANRTSSASPGWRRVGTGEWGGPSSRRSSGRPVSPRAPSRCSSARSTADRRRRGAVLRAQLARRRRS